MKHTPGPWYQVGFWVEHEDDSVADICTCNPDDFGQGHIKRSQSEIVANAMLIAAAPDLLAALEELLPRFENLRELAGFEAESDAAIRARAAITKAKGE